MPPHRRHPSRRPRPSGVGRYALLVAGALAVSSCGAQGDDAATVAAVPSEATVSPVAFPFADDGGVVVAPDGSRALVASDGAVCVAVLPAGTDAGCFADDLRFPTLNSTTAWRPDGSRLSYIDAASFDTVTLDLDARTATVGTAPAVSPLAWSPDGAQLLALGYLDDAGLVLVDAATGATTPLGDLTFERVVRALWPVGTTAYVQTEDSDGYQLWRIDTTKGTATALALPSGDAFLLASSADGSTLALFDRRSQAQFRPATTWVLDTASGVADIVPPPEPAGSGDIVSLADLVLNADGSVLLGLYVDTGAESVLLVAHDRHGGSGATPRTPRTLFIWNDDDAAPAGLLFGRPMIWADRTVWLPGRSGGLVAVTLS